MNTQKEAPEYFRLTPINDTEGLPDGRYTVWYSDRSGEILEFHHNSFWEYDYHREDNFPISHDHYTHYLKPVNIMLPVERVEELIKELEHDIDYHKNHVLTTMACAAPSYFNGKIDASRKNLNALQALQEELKKEMEIIK